MPLNKTKGSLTIKSRVSWFTWAIWWHNLLSRVVTWTLQTLENLLCDCQSELCFVCVVLKASVPVGQIKLENIETKTISSEDVSSEFEQGN